MKNFNINGYVKVRLTDAGLKELERQHQELRSVCPNIGEFRPRKSDSKGYTKWQAHDLMSSLGHLCILGGEPPFDLDILIDV